MIISLSSLMIMQHNYLNNWHYHISPEGFLIVHAHPYKPISQDKPGASHAAGHKHSAHEFSFLQATTHLIFYMALALLLTGIFILRKFNFLTEHGHFYKPVLLTNFNYRGPPVWKY